MKKDSLIDYSSYIALKIIGPIIRFLPLLPCLFLGKAVGELLYYFDPKHKAVAYANIKRALGAQLTRSQIRKITKHFYHNLGQSLIEIILIPKVNKNYINKYIKVEGSEYIREAFKKGKGVILVGVHAGSWELSNIICANLGFPFNLFVREQRHKRLDGLLNAYRQQKGCKLVQRKNQIRELIQILKNNESIGMTADQGGHSGTLVKFFAQDASMPTGAIKLALKYAATILPAYYTRINGPYQKVIIEPPFEIEARGDEELDIRENLERLTSIFQRLIQKYPQDYLWTYKIWKYSSRKNVLLLSDGRAGHLRQAQAVSNILSNCLKEKNTTMQVDTIEIEFKNKYAKSCLTFTSLFSGRYNCQGCLWCFAKILTKYTYEKLISLNPDVIISAGATSAPLNFILSRENAAKSIIIMRPGLLSTRRFDLVIMPRHDKAARGKNIVITEGALNLIDERYLEEQAERLVRTSHVTTLTSQLCIGLFIGGNSKHFRLHKEIVKEVCSQIKSACDKLNAAILVTTSRRTSKEAESIIKEEFKDYPRCKLLIIANEKNIPEAVGGILGLSSIVVTSPESISMISEAASSKKFVVAFKAEGLSKKHERFIRHFAENNYLYLVEPSDLGSTIENIWRNKPKMKVLQDNFVVRKAIEKLL